MRLFKSPFAVDPVNALHELQLELIDLQRDDELHFCHQQLFHIDFYRQLNIKKFPYVEPFLSTYICEQIFSVLNLNKSRVVTTAVQPDLAHELQCRSQFHLTNLYCLNVSFSKSYTFFSKNFIHVLF